jgi:hypothetical protein
MRNLAPVWRREAEATDKPVPIPEEPVSDFRGVHGHYLAFAHTTHVKRGISQFSLNDFSIDRGNDNPHPFSVVTVGEKRLDPEVLALTPALKRPKKVGPLATYLGHGGLQPRIILLDEEYGGFAPVADLFQRPVASQRILHVAVIRPEMTGLGEVHTHAAFVYELGCESVHASVAVVLD